MIVSGTQQEREVIQTRTVTNHNHCHALTVMYYEVLRHFKVVTEWVNKKDVLLIQCPLVTFNEGTAMANRLVLERVLLDPRLRECFAALVKKHCFDLGIIATTPPSSGDDHFLEGLTIVVATGEHDPGGDFSLKLDKKSGGTTYLVGYQLPVRLLGVPRPDHPQLYSVHPEDAVRWNDISQIKIAPDDGTWTLKHLYAETSHGDETWVLCDEEINETLAQNEPRSFDVVPRGGSKPDVSLTAEERCCVEELLIHLRANQVYYSRANLVE